MSVDPFRPQGQCLMVADGAQTFRGPQWSLRAISPFKLNPYYRGVYGLNYQPKLENLI